MSPPSHFPAVVLGAGPAGLTAGYELARRQIAPLVLEAAPKVGGIARTDSSHGYSFDIGGHRFYTRIAEVEALWRQMMGPDFIKVPRLSRIHYRGKMFHYPLDPLNALWNLGPWESGLIVLSYLHAKCFPNPEETNFEQWVCNRFGRRLFLTFFKTYTEKVWGIPCDKIQAEWAAQRIRGLSLKTAFLNAVFGTRGVKTLIKEFDYPVLGPGMMWERFQASIEAQGGEVRLGARVTSLGWRGSRIERVSVESQDGQYDVSADHYLSSIPLTSLIARLDPPAPPEVAAAAKSLRYRDFLMVGLIVDRSDLFPDNWIYIHSPEVQVGRIQNFKNWSAAMVPDPRKTSLGMEYFCNTSDELWRMSDASLIELATREAEMLGLTKGERVEDGVVLRQPKAYPVYDGSYRAALDVIQNFLGTLENLQTIGRNGMHRYNNQDHSMLTAMLAVRNILGEEHDLWSVNTERSYNEERESGKANLGGC